MIRCHTPKKVHTGDKMLAFLKNICPLSTNSAFAVCSDSSNEENTNKLKVMIVVVQASYALHLIMSPQNWLKASLETTEEEALATFRTKSIEK